MLPSALPLDLDALRLGAAHLRERLYPGDTAALAIDPGRAESLDAMVRSMGEALAADHRDAVAGTLEVGASGTDPSSLTVADVVRIRLIKWLARELPPAILRDPVSRRRLRAHVRDLAEGLLGPLATSRYLDGATRRAGPGPHPSEPAPSE